MEKSLPDMAANSMGFAVASEHYRPYPTYRDSGVEWLGKIPSHWKVKKISHLFAVGSGTTPPTNYSEYYGGGIPWVTTSELRESVVTSTEKSVTKKALRAFSALNLYPKGSIAVAMYGATIGRLGILGTQAAVNQACCVFSKPEGIEIWFWFYWLQFRRPYLISLGYGGGQPNLSQELLKSIRVPIPPLHEQRNIVHSLDRETAKVDELVAKKERLIELLQEKRTALITRAVTKGLSPDAPMKDSGVEWLGEIPSHWEIRQLNRVIEKFVDYRGKTPEKVSFGVPLVTAKNIKNQMIDFSISREFISEELYPRWMVRGLPEPGDVIVTTEAPLGECAQVNGTKIALAQRIILLKAMQDKISNDYLKYHFVSDFGQRELQTRSTGSTALGIKASHLKVSLIVVPPIEEQVKIVTLLDRESAKIDALISKIREAIDRLKELRTALISAAVTGKIDLRKAVP